jgi:drug/metabolite transporter superfamily protein YnfA
MGKCRDLLGHYALLKEAEMEAVLFIIGAFFVILGSFFVLYTEQSRRTLVNLTGLVSLKIFAILPLVIGGLLMLSGPWSQSTWLVETLGILALAKGILLLLLPKAKVEPYLAWWQESVSDMTWRLSGLICVILGVFLILRI